MDKASIRCSEKASPWAWPRASAALLLIECQRERKVALARRKRARHRSEQRRCRCDLTEDPVEADKLWQARGVALQATYNINPVKIAEDVVVPRSEIPAFIRQCTSRRMQEKFGVPILSFGHAGDGNFHVSLMIKDTAENRQKAGGAVKEISPRP